MADPFEVLELPKHAGEGEIRKRYLELVRAFPPEQAPERFAAVHAAYQALRDPAARLAVAALRLRVRGRLARNTRRRPSPETAQRPASGRNSVVPGGLFMNDRVDVDEIIDRFREWLDSARAEAGSEGTSSRATSESQTPPANSASSI